MAYKPTTAYKGSLPTSTVKKGSKGTSVKAVQTFLNWCIGTKLSTDGVCGSNTVAAIKKWQTQYKLKVDGVFGAQSKAEAKKIIAKYDSTKKTTKKTTVSPYYNKVVRIGQACANEKGGLTSGQAGDQTKREVVVTNWGSSYGWIYVFRAKDTATRLKLAKAMMATCTNNNIGYDTKKPDRYSAYDEAKKLNWDIKKINKKCETTCSQAVSMCMRAAGIPATYAPRHFDIATMTKVMLKSPYFYIYKSSAYTKSSAKLQPGDILLSSHHTAIVVKSPNVPVVKTPQDKMKAWAKKIAADNSYHYVFYSSGQKAHECPVCHKHAKGKFHGWNCIGYAWGSWHHGAGLKTRCSCDVINNAQYEKILSASKETALKLAQQRVGTKKLKVIRNRSGIALEKLKPGDVIAYFNGNKYVHTALYIGNGKIADCTSGRKDQIKYGAKSYTTMTIKLAFRYTGK